MMPTPPASVAEPPSRSVDWPRFLTVLVELLLIATVIFLFEIEQNRHLFPVICLLIAGFAIHAWLPQRQRLTCFAALSILCVLFVLGLTNGLVVLAIGGTLIGICYLPGPCKIRLGLIVAAVGVLVILRRQSPLPFWPVVGSMFMFRLISFLYECEKGKTKPHLTWAVSYFFLLPNPCFPFFPVVDFKTFRETWNQKEEWETYQRGISWIVCGLIHLLLYRYLRTNIVPQPYELYDVPHILLFMVTNYALYLQVSGQFHLITGLLHLFGFHLPRTHHHYFLASSFSDIWRRINIYWKDFLSKFVFYPTFYALRGRQASAGFALVCSVMLVFLSTWLLHSWQTFWLLGRFPLTSNDAALWLGGGAVVAANILLDSRRRDQGHSSVGWAAFSLAARTVGMFLLVSLFWSCWTKPGFLALLGPAIHRSGATQGLWVVTLWIAAAILLGTLFILARKRWFSDQSVEIPRDFFTSAKLHLALLGLVIAGSLPGSAILLTPGLAAAIAKLRTDPATAEVAGGRLQSYYEDLNSAVIQAGPLLNALSPSAPSATARREQAEGFYKVSRPADLYQQLDLIPGIETEIEGKSFSVNVFGMRDRNSLTLNKPQRTIRVAMVGSSIVMGYGVSDDEVFSRELQRRLNEPQTPTAPAIEILNFGVGKQWAPHRLVRIQRKVFGFEPDYLFYFAHQDEFRELASHTAQLVAQRLELPSRHLQEVVARSGVNAEMAPGAIQSRLQRDEAELLLAINRTIVDECRRRGILPVWIYLPVPAPAIEDPREKLVALAESAGFVVCDLSGWTTVREGLFDATEEFHPNAAGHQRIADALIQMLRDHRESIPFPLPE